MWSEPAQQCQGFGFLSGLSEGMWQLSTYFYNHGSPIPAFPWVLGTNLTPLVGKQGPSKGEACGSHSTLS